MNTTSKQTSDPVEWGPLVLHIRRLRQWYGNSGISQEHLALLADLSVKTVNKYESCRQLPALLHSMILLSLALKVPMEWLFAPELIEKYRAKVEKRRQHFESSSNCQAEPPSNIPLYEGK